MSNVVNCGYVHTPAVNPAKPPVEVDCGFPALQPVAASLKAEEPPAAVAVEPEKPADAPPVEKPRQARK